MFRHRDDDIADGVVRDVVGKAGRVTDLAEKQEDDKSAGKEF
jgi:hypothetical protein